MLRGLGALTVAAVAAVPSDRRCKAARPCPRLALLEAHKHAWARLLKLEDRTDDHETLEDAGRAVDSALEEIMKTPPTTPAGARADRRAARR